MSISYKKLTQRIAYLSTDITKKTPVYGKWTMLKRVLYVFLFGGTKCYWCRGGQFRREILLEINYNLKFVAFLKAYSGTHAPLTSLLAG